MATDKPRFSVTFTDESFQKIQEYKDENNLSTQSKAVAQLVEIAINELEKSDDMKIAPLYSSEAMEVAKTFDQLDGHGRGAVKAILDFEHASAVAEKRQSGTPKRPDLKVRKRSDGFVDYRVYDQPAAAGLGNYLDDPAYHIEQYPANVVPDGADFGIRISGTSMSPDIPDAHTAACVQILPAITGAPHPHRKYLPNHPHR